MLSSLVNDPRIAGLVAFATSAAGISSWFKWIPDDIGKLATVIGVILTTVLIFTHASRGRLERRSLELDLALKKRKLEDLNDERDA